MAGLNRYVADVQVNGAYGMKRMSIPVNAIDKNEANQRVVDLAVMQYENETRQRTTKANVTVLQLNYSW